MIRLVVLQFFPTPNGGDKLELNFEADALIEIKALASYEFLDMDEPMIEDERSYPIPIWTRYIQVSYLGAPSHQTPL